MWNDDDPRMDEDAACDGSGPGSTAAGVRILVAGWVGSTNLGDELVFAGVRRLLEDRGAQVAAVSVDPAATRRDHGVGAAEANDPIALEAAVSSADAMVFGGGGLLQDVSSPYNLPYHLTRVALARARRTPVVGLALGVGELRTALGRRLTRAATNGMVAVSVRDAPSQRLLAEVGGPPATLAADAALTLEAPDVEVEDRLVVSLRSWAGPGGWRPAAGRGDLTPQDSVDALARALDAASHTTGLAVRFVALQQDRDDAFHRRVAERMTAEATFATPGLDGILGEFAAARAVIAMRYHAAIGALLAGRPAVQLSYSSKVAALAADIADGGQGLAFAPDGIVQIPATLHRVMDHDERRPDHLADRLAALRDRAAGNGRVLDALG